MSSLFSQKLKLNDNYTPEKINIIENIFYMAFNTHPNLTDEDKKYIINLIIKQNYSIRDLSDILVRVHKQTNTGKFSLIYNLILDNNIKAKSSKLPELLKLSATKKAWSEVYQNNLLNKEDIDIIEKMSNQEYQYILNAIKSTLDDLNLERFDWNSIIPCSSNCYYNLSYDSDGIYYNIINSECNSLQLKELKQYGKIISFDSKNIKTAYIHEHPINYKNYKTMNLIEQLANNNFIDPDTNQPFNQTVLTNLLNIYKLEINLYKKYLIFNSN